MGKSRRKEKYDPKVHPKKAEALAEQGLIDSEIARGLGISRSKFYEWKKKFLDFSDSINRGKEQPDADIARAFFKNCMGYDYEETKVTAVLDKDGKPVGKQVVTRTKKHRPGSVYGQALWLRLRQPQEWDPALAVSQLGPNRVPALDKLPEHLLREIAMGQGVLHDGEIIDIDTFAALNEEKLDTLNEEGDD